MIVDTLLVSAAGTSCGASMVKMSVDFPNEAARCQRFLSGLAQSNYVRGGKHGPAAMRQRAHFPATDGAHLPFRNGQTERGVGAGSLVPVYGVPIRPPCYLLQNTRNRTASAFGKSGLWLSLVERLVRDQEAVGSNPTSPISTNRRLSSGSRDDRPSVQFPRTR